MVFMHVSMPQRRRKWPRRGQDGTEQQDRPGPDTKDDPDPLENIEDLNVIMTVSCGGGAIGVAIYENETAAMAVFQGQEDVKGTFAYSTLQLIRVQCNPSIIYTSSKSDSELLAALRKPACGPDGPTCPVHIERAAAFHHDKAIQRLEKLVVAGHPECGEPREHLAFLNTMIDISRQQQVCALGALLVVLQKANALSCRGEDAGTGVVVNSLTEFNLQSCLVVDPSSLSALSIIQEERHASLMGLGKSKEGFSLFGLLNRCVTPMGKRLLRSWFMRPVIDLDIINDRLDTVQLLVGAQDVQQQLQDQLKKVADLPRLLQRLQQSQAAPELRTFLAMQDSLLQLLRLREVFVELVGKQDQQQGRPATEQQPCRGARTAEPAAPTQQQEAVEDAYTKKPSWLDVSITQQVLDHINEELPAAYALLSHVIDAEQKEEGMLVAAGVCDELDVMKETYQGLPDLLTRVLEAELARVPTQVARLHLHDRQLWSISYLPQVGYAIQVTSHELPEELLEVLPDYQLEFEVDCGDEITASLCVELLSRLQKHAPAMQQAASAAATLDCLVAFASASASLNYSRPVLTHDNILDIRGGRHPLAEVALLPSGSVYIPNDTHMTADSERVHVITGPNASGKSCYAKQVALITYMAHLGCFVPATSAMVGVADRIMTRLVSAEHVAAHASAFSQDLTQVSRMVHQATGRSILVIDEFGKGTLAADGVGLMAGLLKEFCNRQDAPRIVTCTHFHELFDQEVLPKHPLMSFFTMEVITEGNGAGTGQQAPVKAGQTEATSAGACPVAPAVPASSVVFLHRLVPGYASPSFGIHCAQLCGVRQDVVDRARQVLAMHQAKQAVQPHPAGLDANQYTVCESWVRKLASLALGDDQLHMGQQKEQQQQPSPVAGVDFQALVRFMQHVAAAARQPHAGGADYDHAEGSG